jgi:hypothetical protein
VNEVEHRLVFHHVGRGDERIQNDARPSTIDDVMVVVSEPDFGSVSCAHGHGVRVG